MKIEILDKSKVKIGETGTEAKRCENVTWTCIVGTGTFTPSVIVDSTTYSLAPESLSEGSNITKLFTVTGLSAGTHSICPNPN